MEGLISFPSFHTANAILFIWALWPLRLLRPVILVVNVLLIASTPLAGAHYLVDLIGGAVVAVGAIWLTSWLVRSPPATALVPITKEVGVYRTSRCRQT
jgi:membrane-associated phospholipid phosphatase